jgi:DNA-binding transcriptional LysR family regulator
MAGVQLTELTAFVAVAEHRSFTKAAAQVGISLPTMSLTIRALEQRLGIRLFNRTTRNVALTVAGDRLLTEIQPLLASIDHAIDNVNSFRDKPIGTLRLAVARNAAMMFLAPIIKPFLAEYPSICLEIAIDDTHSDIISGRFDAGIRVGFRVERDMTVIRFSDEFKVIAVAAPAYLEGRPKLVVPKDLYSHDCIQIRTPWDGSIFPWTFINGKQSIELAVKGPLIVNDLDLLLSSALDGVGVAYLPEPMVAPLLSEGRLVTVLEGWNRPVPGYFIYHPSRRQSPMPLQVFLKFVKKWRKTAVIAARE